MKDVIKLLNDNLERHISNEIYENFFSQTYTYSLLPAGKLFRPLLVWAISQDFNKNKDFSDAHQKLASMVEIHHTYTLIHDDMPCMDDDDMRRGRESTHKKFGQWQALLAGDGLLNASYSILAKINSEYLGQLLRYATWTLGPKGLILGQALDLGGVMNNSFEDLILTHTLKTARLIQLCLNGSFLLCEDSHIKKSYDNFKSIHKLGQEMGIAFQLLDDLCELEVEKLSKHEDDINPWPKNSKICFERLNKSLNNIDTFYKNFECENLQKVYSIYLEKIKTLLRGSQLNIEKHIKMSLDPILVSLDRLS